MKIKIVILTACGILLCSAGFAQPEAASNVGRLITLPEGIGIVLRDSRVIKAASFDKDMAFEDSLMARSALFPHLTANMTQTFLTNQPASRFGIQSVNTAQRQSFAYGFDVYQTLFDFGKSISGYKASQEAVAARQAGIETVKRLAVLEFIMSYYDILEAEKMIGVVEKEKQSLTSYLRDIQHMYEQGAAIQNDLLPAKVRLADAGQRLIAAKNARTTAITRLNNILALPLQEKIRVKDISMRLPGFPGMEAAWKTAQEQRPEVAFYETQIKASALVERAKAVDNFPELFADAGYSHAENRYMVKDDNWFLNLGAKANVFDGGSARAEISTERYRQLQLREQKTKMVEDIKFEVENSYLGLKDAGEKVSVAKEAVAQSKENVRVNRVKFTEGIATSTEVLEAITMQTNAQTNYYTADYEQKRNYARLMYAMGIDLPLVYDSMGRKTNGAK